MEGLTPELMAIRAAIELRDGMYVNLGIGLPALVSDFIAPDKQVVLHSENGVLGVGRIAEETQWDTDLINASGNPVTLMPGHSFFDSAVSFAMVRGGRLDVSILGAFEVSANGDLANWRTAGQKVGSVGGAMDVATGAKRVIVLMEHTTRKGTPKIVKECRLPLTAKSVVNTIITNLALIEVTQHGLVVRELAPGVSLERVRELTEPPLIVDTAVKVMDF